MGRVNSALAEQNKEIRALAQWLRTLRERSGLTYSQMAHKTTALGLPTSISTLSRADEGRTVPTWPVTEAYTRACGGSLRTAERLWLRADGNRPGRKRAIPVPCSGQALRYITESSELLHAMRQLRLQAGQPSMRELENRAIRGQVSHLPHSTLHGVLAGERDCTERTLIEFIRACGVSPEDATEWVEALHRIEVYKRTGGPQLSEVQRRLAEAEDEIRRLKTALTRVPEAPGETPSPLEIPVPARRRQRRSVPGPRDHRPVSRAG